MKQILKQSLAFALALTFSAHGEAGVAVPDSVIFETGIE